MNGGTVQNAAGTALTGYTGWTRAVVIHERLFRLEQQRDGPRLACGHRYSHVSFWNTTTTKVYRRNIGGTQQPLSANATLVT